MNVPYFFSRLYQVGWKEDGVYCLEPVDGQTFDAYCNMRQGGWTLIGQTSIDVDDMDDDTPKFKDGWLRSNKNLGMYKCIAVHDAGAISVLTRHKLTNVLLYSPPR